MQVWRTILRSVLNTLMHTSFTDTTALNSKLFALDVFFRPPALQRLLVGHDTVFQSRRLKARKVVLRHPSVKCVVFCLQLMQSVQIVVNTKFPCVLTGQSHVRHTVTLQMLHFVSSSPSFPPTVQLLIQTAPSCRLLCCWRRLLRQLASLARHWRLPQYLHLCSQVTHNPG